MSPESGLTRLINSASGRGSLSNGAVAVPVQGCAFSMSAGLLVAKTFLEKQLFALASRAVSARSAALLSLTSFS